MSYPEQIEIPEGTEEFKEIMKHSQLIREIVDSYGVPLILDKDLFAGDQTKWELFVDLLYPHLGTGNLFLSGKNNSIVVNPKRATSEDIIDMMDFLLIDKPDTMMEFAREKARLSSKAPAVIEKKEKIPQRMGRGARQFFQRQEYLQRRFRGEPTGNNNNRNYGEENSPKGQGAEVRVNTNENAELEAAKNVEEERNEESRYVPSSARHRTLNEFIAAALAKKSGSRRRNRRTQRRNRQKSRKARK